MLPFHKKADTLVSAFLFVLWEAAVDDLIKKCKSKAIYLLSRREHGEKELLKKLIKENSGDCQFVAMAEEVVEELVQRDYVSDTRFAEMTVRSQIARGYGPNRIRQTLVQKEVPADIMEQVLESLEVDWFANVVAVRGKKFGLGVVDDMKLKAKQQRFLQYKGYGFDHIQYAMEANGD